MRSFLSTHLTGRCYDPGRAVTGALGWNNHREAALSPVTSVPCAWASPSPRGGPIMPTASAESVAFSAGLDVVRAVEPRIADAIAGELAAQRGSLKLIASENYASPATLLAMGNWLSDKYAEGTIGRRFYAGCQHVDTVEAIAAEHARELFGVPHAYVQPHSGIDANLVAFWAILAHRVEAPALRRAQVRHVNDLTEGDWAALRHELGDQRMLGMALDAGGHLTHGFRPNISGKMFQQQSYGTDPGTGLLDYDALRRTAKEFRPLILVGGYSAYPRRINFALMREIADEVGHPARGHGALRRAGRRESPHRRLRPCAARPHRHHHHPQDAARPPGWHGPVPRRTRRTHRPRAGPFRCARVFAPLAHAPIGAGQGRAVGGRAASVRPACNR